MSEKKNRGELHTLFGALLGGLIASFVASAVFGALAEPSEGTAFEPLTALLIGLTCAVMFMIGGLYVTEKLPWLGSSLLFASGFTALWSAVVSFGAEPRWAVLAALGVAIGIGVVMGWHRFGREPKGWRPAGKRLCGPTSVLARADAQGHRRALRARAPQRSRPYARLRDRSGARRARRPRGGLEHRLPRAQAAEADGLVAATWETGAPGNPRKYYEITRPAPRFSRGPGRVAAHQRRHGNAPGGGRMIRSSSEIIEEYLSRLRSELELAGADDTDDLVAEIRSFLTEAAGATRRPPWRRRSGWGSRPSSRGACWSSAGWRRRRECRRVCGGGWESLPLSTSLSGFRYRSRQRCPSPSSRGTASRGQQASSWPSRSE